MKVRSVLPLLRDYRGFVVIKKKECGYSRRLKTEIFGRKRKCRWCLKGVEALTK